MRWLAVVVLSVVAAGCWTAPYESNSPAWHDTYAKRKFGAWHEDPGYAIPHEQVKRGHR